MKTAAKTVALVLAAHVILKFAFFFLPYSRRRAALDEQYAGRATATTVTDVVTLAIAAAVAIVMRLAGRAGVGFLAGTWVGASLIQVYFHRFHTPLTPDEAPADPQSPIKTMSYAIQAHPWAAAREVGLFSAIVAMSVAAILTAS